ncbi:MAG: hypothetical protein NNA25_12700 [Nitrospira sp.]|nr:hypothetical protein [Nitrospira sp.]
MPDGLQQYVNLENRLVLLAWLNSLLGYRSNGELLENCKTVGEGFGADGHSFLYHHLIARSSQVKIPPTTSHTTTRTSVSIWRKSTAAVLRKSPCVTSNTWPPFTPRSSSTACSLPNANCWPT